jgi:hypothetical protein
MAKDTKEAIKNRKIIKPVLPKGKETPSQNLVAAKMKPPAQPKVTKKSSSPKKSEKAPSSRS